LRTAEETPVTWDRVLVPLAVAVAAAVGVLVLPSAGSQVLFLAAVIVGVGSLVLASSDRIMNAALIPILFLFLIDPLGVLLTRVGSPVSIVIVLVAAPLPFVIMALLQRPAAFGRLSAIAPLALLVGLAAASIAWSPDADYGVRKAILWVTAGLAPCAYVLILTSPDRPPSWRAIALVALVYSLVLLAIGTTTIYPGRIVFFEANPIWIGRAAFIGAIVVLLGPFPLIVRLGLAAPMLVAGILTDSLGPTIGLVLGLGAGLAEGIRVAPGARRLASLRLGLLAVLVALGVAVAFAVLGSDPSRLAPVLEDPNVASRAIYLQRAAEMFGRAPVLGAGFGAFATQGLDAPYPHNLIAEMAAELGIVGVTLAVIWIGFALWRAAGSPLLVALVVATTAFAMFSGNVAGNSELWIFSGIAIAMTGRGAKPLTPARPQAPPGPSLA
jgi:O-antigen ligase